VYVSIEDVGGSRFDDKITGDGNNNRLMGNSGNDTLIGMSGNDTLRGGRGDDRPTGRSGNDILDGGSGSDVFSFADGFGSDEITDFNRTKDTLEINLNLLGATPASSARVLSDYGSIVGSDAVLNFGDGDMIGIEYIDDLSMLAASMTFI